MSSSTTRLLIRHTGMLARARSCNHVSIRISTISRRSFSARTVQSTKSIKSRAALAVSLLSVGGAMLYALSSEPSTVHAAAADSSLRGGGSGGVRPVVATRLCSAAARGDLAEVEAAAAQSKSLDDIVNVRHPSGWTPLMAAAANGHSDVVDWLIANGARVNDTDSYRGGRPLARREFHPRINPQISCAQWTPLHYAVAFNHLDVAQSLLKNGADPDAKNAEGDTPDTCIQWDILGEHGKAINEQLKSMFQRVRQKRAEDRALREKEERIRFPLEAKLRNMMVGQIMPIFSVASAIRRRDNGWFDENKPLVLMFLGSSGVGKCFARDTPILMHDGTVRPVQSIRAGDRLMGDDSSPRTVIADSIVRGRGELYKITPTTKCADPFICNGDHVLVLQLHRQATVVTHDESGAATTYSVRSRSVDANGAIEFSMSGYYKTLEECEAEVERLNSAPIILHCSVIDYLKSTQLRDAHTTLFRAKELIYENEFGDSHFRQIIHDVVGALVSSDELEEFAWRIGVWISTGKYLCESDRPDAVLLRAQWHYDETTMRTLIERLHISDSGFVPHALMTESLSIRRSLVRGLIDGSDNAEYKIFASNSDILLQYKQLALSVGLRAHQINDIAAHPDRPLAIALSGGFLRAHKCSTGLLLDATRKPVSDSYENSYEFTVRALGTGDYYGFAVDGNHRFLLGDQTVTHNTMLSKELAKHIVRDQENGFIRIDCTEYQSKHEMARLIGSPPGYVGYEEGGQLTTKLDKCPDAVVLLDEVEKAHPDVLTLMLQVFDEGRLTDGKGKTIHCPNAIFIMTSNLVQEEIRNAIQSRDYALRPTTVVEQREIKSADAHSDLLGIPETQSVIVPVPKISEATQSPYDDEGPPEPTDELTISICAKQTDTFLRRIVYPILKRHFKREEFLGRINDYVVFHHLSQSDLRATVKMELSRWKKKAFERHHIDIQYSDRLVESLKSGYDERYGYRSIIYTVEKRLVNVLAAAHERDMIKPGCLVEIDVEDDDKGERAGRVYIKSVKENAVKLNTDKDTTNTGRFFGMF